MATLATRVQEREGKCAYASSSNKMPTQKIDEYLELDVTMENEGLQVLLLHRHPEYLTACCQLINDEWPRSETARMMSLQASCDQLPTSLILINDKKQVLGHCKLTAIPSIPLSCFLETVVISKSMRGKKLGTFMLKEVEEYCRSVLKLMMLHLSTKGQERFYEKLGYVLCAPVSIYGTRLPPPQPITASNPPTKSDNKVPVQSQNSTAVPSAPPPPPMPKISSSNVKSSIKSDKTFMFKFL